MITFLDGKLVTLCDARNHRCGRRGYEVLIPLSSYDRLPEPGLPIRILTHLAVREDAHVFTGS